MDIDIPEIKNTEPINMIGISIEENRHISTKAEINKLNEKIDMLGRIIIAGGVANA